MTDTPYKCSQCGTPLATRLSLCPCARAVALMVDELRIMEYSPESEAPTIAYVLQAGATRTIDGMIANAEDNPSL
jgi:hypothetical protein